MELPCRPRGQELLRAGEFTKLIGRLRRIAPSHDLRTVIACAFDHRTRMLPFVYADMRMAPAGVRAIGSCLLDAGFPRTRIVLQQWNKHFLPSKALLDGKLADIFMVSAMNIHAAAAKALIRDACRIAPEHRPLVIAGGPKAIYEPWDLFSPDPADPWAADVVVTGEEYVLVSFMERLLSMRLSGEPLRRAFLRGRDAGAFDSVPGLVFARGDVNGVARQLVDTGVQRLLGNLDELPQPVLGFSILEKPGRGAGLAERPLTPKQVRKYTPVCSLVLTFGCRFSCPYCPIPAYNQRQSRGKSGARVAEEMTRLNREYDLNYFFGADDNFFNDSTRALDIIETLARAQINGKPLRHSVRWATEATVHDTLAMRDHLGALRKAGCRALWLGVEDMTGALVKKGQTIEGTVEAFGLLSRHGICPMPMMMHHDDQPLITFGNPRGLINQVRILRKAGAVSLQILALTPAVGSKHYDEAFESGAAFESVGGRKVEPYMVDGNYVTASRAPKPWRKQAGMLLAYLYFYNPIRLLVSIVHPISKLYIADFAMQCSGVWGLARNVRRTLGWLIRLWRCDIKRTTAAPRSPIPIISVTQARPQPQERAPAGAGIGGGNPPPPGVAG